MVVTVESGHRLHGLVAIRFLREQEARFKPGVDHTITMLAKEKWAR
jgi:hypothetical protein